MKRIALLIVVITWSVAILGHDVAGAALTKIASGSVQLYGNEAYDAERAQFVAGGCATNQPQGTFVGLINIRPYRGKTLVVSASGADTYSEDTLGKDRTVRGVYVTQFWCSPDPGHPAPPDVSDPFEYFVSGMTEGTAPVGKPLTFVGRRDYLAVFQYDPTPAHVNERFTLWRQ